MLDINNIESLKCTSYYDGKPYVFSYCTKNIVEYVINVHIGGKLKGFVRIYRRPVIIGTDGWLGGGSAYTVELLSDKKTLIWKHKAYEHMLSSRDTFFEKFAYRIKEFYVTNPRG